jgi:hypothetical protein
MGKAPLTPAIDLNTGLYAPVNSRSVLLPVTTMGAIELMERVLPELTEPV